MSKKTGCTVCEFTYQISNEANCPDENGIAFSCRHRIIKAHIQSIDMVDVYDLDRWQCYYNYFVVMRHKSGDRAIPFLWPIYRGLLPPLHRPQCIRLYHRPVCLYLDVVPDWTRLKWKLMSILLFLTLFLPF